MYTTLANIVSIILAAILGGLIGYERERDGHYAGIRTHMLVCMTSAMLISTFSVLFEMDSTARVAAALMTGIGFIGAGTILMTGYKVTGLTTAASVWAVAAMGIVIAIGFYFESLVMTFLVVMILEMKHFRKVKKHI